MDLSLLIINIVAGALVGYITKTLAINMLFKKYPVIGGAEIIKDRVNLEIAMSELVEERLIKPSTVLEEFQKEEFKVSFEKLINHIIESTINENIKNLDTISEIKGFPLTSSNLYNFLITNRERILQPCVEALFDNVMIRDVLSPEQLNFVVEKLLARLSEVVIQNIEPIIGIISKELGNTKFDELISKDLLIKISENILESNLQQVLQEKLEPEIDSFLDETYKNLDLDTIIEKIDISLKNKTLYQLLGEKNNGNGLNHLIERLGDFINSEKGKILLNDFIGHLIEIIKTIDVPLSSLITGEIEQRILIFVEKYSPELIERVEEWIALNKVEMEEIINNAVEEHLETESLVKQLIGTIFVQKLAERYQLVESTLEELKKMAQNTGPNMINILNRFLDNTQVSALAKYLDSNILDRNALLEAVILIINNYLPRINFTVLEPIFHKKLNEIALINNIKLSSLFKDHLYQFFKQQLKENLLFNSGIKNNINELIKNKIESLSEKSLNSLLKGTKNINYQKIILETVGKPKLHSIIINRILQVVPVAIQGKTLNQIITKGIKNDLDLKMGNLYNSKVSSVLEVLKKEKVLTLYKRTARIYADLCKNNFFSKKITDTLINMMVHLIRENRLLDGKIFLAVKESFEKMSDQELKDEMDSFMGKELRPIKMLGAFLGAVIGILMYYISFLPDYGTYAKGYWALLTYSLSYAISEVGTNWLAIKMLFKPYEVKKIPVLGIPLPFTPGVFPKNKKALAESMVNFIDKKLLSKDNMVRILEKYQHKWKEVIRGVVSKNNYARYPRRIFI